MFMYRVVDPQNVAYSWGLAYIKRLLVVDRVYVISRTCIESKTKHDTFNILRSCLQFWFRNPKNHVPPLWPALGVGGDADRTAAGVGERQVPLVRGGAGQELVGHHVGREAEAGGPRPPTAVAAPLLDFVPTPRGQHKSKNRW